MEITKKIAISEIDFDDIPLPIIFRIFESAVKTKILKISIYQTETGSAYGIAEFESENSAKEAYDFLDGVEIEQSGKIFNLSFVPEDFEFDTLISECNNSRDFNDFKIKNKKLEIDENMIEMSEEIDLGIEIPEEFRSKQNEENQTEEVKKEIDAKESESSDSNRIADAFKNDENIKEDDFQFDIQDGRFKELFENDDFVLDASNKKFKHQKISKTLVEEKYKRIDKNE